MEHSEQIMELAKALSKTQGEIKSVSKDAVNPFFKNKYATLDAIWEAIRKPLSTNGLAVLQTTYDQQGIVLETTLVHSSGQWVRSYLPLNAKANDPQSIGSALTYARRYSLSAILGISADEDDDANAATSKQTVPQTKQPVQPPQQQAEQPKPDAITEQQQKKIFASSKDKNIVEEVKSSMKSRFNKEHTKELTKSEASALIDSIEKGEIKASEIPI
jgi:hypothetical protein